MLYCHKQGWKMPYSLVKNIQWFYTKIRVLLARRRKSDVLPINLVEGKGFGALRLQPQPWILYAIELL